MTEVTSSSVNEKSINIDEAMESSLTGKASSMLVGNSSTMATLLDPDQESVVITSIVGDDDNDLGGSPTSTTNSVHESELRRLGLRISENEQPSFLENPPKDYGYVTEFYYYYRAFKGPNDRRYKLFTAQHNVEVSNVGNAAVEKVLGLINLFSDSESSMIVGSSYFLPGERPCAGPAIQGFLPTGSVVVASKTTAFGERISAEGYTSTDGSTRYVPMMINNSPVEHLSAAAVVFETCVVPAPLCIVPTSDITKEIADTMSGAWPPDADIRVRVNRTQVGFKICLNVVVLPLNDVALAALQDVRCLTFPLHDHGGREHVVTFTANPNRVPHGVARRVGQRKVDVRSDKVMDFTMVSETDGVVVAATRALRQQVEVVSGAGSASPVWQREPEEAKSSATAKTKQAAPKAAPHVPPANAKKADEAAANLKKTAKIDSVSPAPASVERPGDDDDDVNDKEEAQSQGAGMGSGESSATRKSTRTPMPNSKYQDRDREPAAPVGSPSPKHVAKKPNNSTSPAQKALLSAILGH
jgi:hypothetical protein